MVANVFAVLKLRNGICKNIKHIEFNFSFRFRIRSIQDRGES
jgi:hypothetical protein